LTVLLGALGGQGGGVLADWLDAAARTAGYRTQATSIPGVAQRTGATTYYLELYPMRAPERDPVFCLYPSTGNVDLVATLEPTEAGRALERGFITGHTTVISNAARVYSTAEKVISGDGTADLLGILEALQGAARSLLLFDGSDAGQGLNALLLGAIAASGVLPLPVDAYREAITGRGVAVSPNLAAFDRGLTLEHVPAPMVRDGLVYDPPPPGFAERIAHLPETLRPLAGHALARLVDYQGARYAGRYLERLQGIVNIDSDATDYRLSAEVGRRLGAWMSFEDVIRVAQLKTRPGRLARVRAEIGAGPDDLIELHDFLKPGPAEIRAILPRMLGGARPASPPAGRHGTPGFSLRLPTSTPLGYTALKLLASLRPLRPISSGYAHEQAAIERWLGAVRSTAASDYTLACQVAELAVMVRGYGRVRLRGAARLDALLEMLESRLGTDREALRGEFAAALHAARNDPDDEQVALEAAD
jgi:indolepyruvate ferredoxin oxidoreductase beta subunit